MKKSPNLIFEEYDFSKEYFSLETDSPFSIKSNEIKNLDNQRPLGISGHLRARNEGFSIGACIDSVIDTLDELIITIQPYTNKSGVDNTYEICKKAKEKYGDKIKLFYYTPQTNTVPSSHIDDNYKNNTNTSIHNFAHYHNFGLKEITYKYYIKIDADQIYFSDKLKEMREALLNADKYTKDKRTFLNKVLGKILNPFYNQLSKMLSMKNYVALVTIINKRVSFGLSGVQLTLNGGGNLDSKKQYIQDLLEKPLDKDLLYQMTIPLKIHYDRFYCLNGGMDHFIFSPDSKNLYYYLEDHCTETLNGEGHKGIRNLGCFWIHLGMIKRYFLTYGKEGDDFISLDDFLNTDIKDLIDKIQIKAYYTSDYNGSLDNIKYHLENDKKYIRKILNHKK